MAEQEGHSTSTREGTHDRSPHEDIPKFLHTQALTSAEYMSANKALCTLQQPNNGVAHTLSELATILSTHIECKKADKNGAGIIKAVSAVLRVYDREYSNIATATTLENRVDRITQLMQSKFESNLEKLETNIKHIEATAIKYSELTINSQDQATSINEAIQNLNGAAMQSATNTQRTYSEALRQTTGPPANNTTANNAKISNRLNIQATQILIEFDTTSEANNLNRNQTPDATSKMRTKAIEALKKVTEGSKIIASIKHATITRRGGLLIELNSTEAAAWLRKEANAKRFTDTLAAGSKLRKRTYPVILKFIPIRWTPEQPESLRKLEERLDLVKGSIIEAKWIKDPARQGRNQEVAHAKLQCTDPNSANKILISDIYICNARVEAERDTWEPSVCGKCQKYGHFAAECQETSDKCGQCGGSHRTILCTNKSATFCTPCNLPIHTTNSPSCPEYRKRVNVQQVKCPESLMPFYPTEQPWTWDADVAVPWINRPSIGFDMSQAILRARGPYQSKPSTARTKYTGKQQLLNGRQTLLWGYVPEENSNHLPLGQRRRINSVSSNTTARPTSPNTPTVAPTENAATPAATSPTPTNFADIVLSPGHIQLSPEPEEPPFGTATPNAATPGHQAI